MKIFKDGKWITPIIDNNINSSLKIFFNGKWNSIIIKDDYLANAPSNIQYIDAHKVFIYVQGAWYQIAIEEDVVDYNVVEQVLTFKNSDMDKYTSNLLIRPENGLLTAMRVARSTTDYQINRNTNHSFTNGLAANNVLVKLVGANPILVDIMYNNKTKDDFRCDSYPTYQSTYVECKAEGTSTETITTSFKDRNNFEIISEVSPRFMVQHIECDSVATTQEDIDFSNNTIDLFTTNHLMYALPAYVELTQRANDTIFIGLDRLEILEYEDVRLGYDGVKLNNNQTRGDL